MPETNGDLILENLGYDELQRALYPWELLIVRMASVWEQIESFRQGLGLIDFSAEPTDDDDDDD